LFLFQCWGPLVFYIELFIPKLVPAKDTLRVRHRDTPSFDTPVVTNLGEGPRQKILIHQVFNRSVKVWTGCRGPLPSMFLAPGSLETKRQILHSNFFSGNTKSLRSGWLKKCERIRINLSHLGLVPGLCHGSRVFPTLEPWHQVWNQPCFHI
jgi:hypothetical protein